MSFVAPLANLTINVGDTQHISFDEFDASGNPVTPFQGTGTVVYGTVDGTPGLSTSVASFTLDANGQGGTFTALEPGSGGARVQVIIGQDTFFSSTFTVTVPTNVAFLGTTSP
jgi:hypothetical protein